MAGPLSGVVTDADGVPLQGVPVYAYDNRLAYEVATTDSDGVWAMDVPDGLWRVRAVPTQSNHVERFYPGVWDFCDGTVLDDAELDFALGVAGQLEGQVLDEDGQPIDDVLVSCLGMEQRNALIGRAALSNEEGRFRCIGLDSAPDGSAYAVSAEVQGWPDQFLGGVYRDNDGPEPVTVTVGEQTDVGVFQLMSGITVEGTLVGYDGPVEGANVHVYSYGQVQDTVSGADGTYAVDGLPPGDVIPWASLPGYGITYYPNNLLPQSVLEADEGDALVDVDIELPEEARITGFVEAEGDLSGITLLAYNETYTVALGAAVDADGAYSAQRLREGIWHLYFYAAAEGYLDDFARDEEGERLTITLDEPGHEVALDVALVLGGTMSGVVLDDHGEPVYGAVVRSAHVDSEEYRARSTRTERDGSYTLNGLAPGPHTIEVSTTVYCEGDPDHTSVWHPDARTEGTATLVDMVGGEHVALDLVSPVDTDHDDMADAWEDQVGLDVGRNDGDEDPDGDGLSNLDEYLADSDPFDEGETGRACGGCNGGASGPWLLLLLLMRRRD
jgi:hypothetical protein